MKSLQRDNIRPISFERSLGRVQVCFAGLLLAIVMFLGLWNCNSEGGLLQGESANTISQTELPAYGIVLFIPNRWHQNYNHRRFYQFIATGFGPNGLPATIEMRSLKIKITDPAGKNLFAAGWYKSPRVNFGSSWKYIRKRKIPGDILGGFELEGTFVRDGVRYRRFGRLRFRENRLHSIYYTIQDSGVKHSRNYFDNLDALHRYYRPTRDKSK